MNLRDDAKAFVDGELDEPRMEEVMSAMESDAGLRGDIEAMRALGFELRRVAVEHDVKGAEKAAEHFKSERAGDYFRKSNRRFKKWALAFSGVGLTLLMIPVLFPTFAQSRGALSNRERKALEAQDGVTVTAEAGESDSGLVEGQTGKGGGGGQVNGGPMAGLSLRRRQPDFDAERKVIYNSNGLDTQAGATTGKADGNARRVSVLRPDLIRTAELSVKVADAPGAMQEAMAIANRMGGFYQSSRAAAGEGQKAIATVTLRVPVKQFDAALIALRKLGDVVEDTSDSEDVTAQIADVGARIKVLRAEEESYVTMLRAGRRVGEILEIKDRLSTVREEIESLTAQQKALKDQSSYSTISCTFTERPKVEGQVPPEAKNWTDDTWANAVNGLKSVGRFLGQAVIVLFVYSAIWLPIAICGWLLGRRILRD